MIIRQERPEDYSAVYSVNKLAFNQKDEAELVNKIRKGKNFIPKLSIVTEKDNKIVGHILISKISIIGKKRYQLLALAPMAVLPEYQRQGIGSELVKSALITTKELGFDSVIVLGHPEYYPRFGFKKASLWNIKCPFEAPDESFMAIELKKGSLFEKSGIVQYPEEFGI